MTDWYAVIDTAQDPALHPLVTATLEHQCLVSGEIAPVLAAALPYVVPMRKGEPLAEAWTAHGSGRNWGILLQSSRGAEALRTHFKKFINAMLPDGTVALFRFYDPRVFRTYIAAATPEERAPWFDGIDRYSVESVTPGQFHDFRFAGGALYDGAQVAT
jgi:hypothetical protein